LQKGFLVIKDPEVAKLLADDTRRRILHLLRHHEMSTTDLAKALDKSHSSIVYHLNLLVDVGLVQETRREMVRNMVQPYYRSTARRFHVSYSLSEALADNEDYSAWQESFLQKLMEGFEAFKIELPEQERQRVKTLLDKCYMTEKRAFERALEQWSEPATIGRHVGMALVRILTQIRLCQDEEHRKAVEELGRLLSIEPMEEDR